MNNWKKNMSVCFFVIIILAFIGCNSNGDNDPKCTCPNGTVHTETQCGCNAVGNDCNCIYDPPEVTREFYDLTFLGKEIKLIDETGNTQNLKERDVWQKIQYALNISTATPESPFGLKFFKIYNSGNFAIIIKSGESSDWAKIDGYKILIHENVLSEDNDYIHDYIYDAISYSMTAPD